MPSTAIDSQIHGCMFSTDEMREILSDKAWVQKMAGHRSRARCRSSRTRRHSKGKSRHHQSIR